MKTPPPNPLPIHGDEDGCAYCGGDLPAGRKKFCSDLCCYKIYALKVGRLQYVEFDPAKRSTFIETSEEKFARRARLLARINPTPNPSP